MAASEHRLTVRRTARYYRIGPDSDVKQIWVVFHGYGQLAGYFIKKFNCLSERAITVVAPEALSRFYLTGFSGRVGASWMTKEDRLNEIADYVAYLDSIYEHVMRRCGAEAQTTLLGFSQGVATAVRWAHAGRVKAQRLIAWADLLPPDFTSEDGLDRLREYRLTLVHGKRDPLVMEGRLRDQERLLREHDVPFEQHLFEGGHELNSDVLIKLSQGCDS